MFEEQYKKANEGLEHMTTSRKQDESFETRILQSPALNIPLGYKSQLAAQTIQKYLRGYLAKIQVKHLMSHKKNESNNRYKRINVSCEYCNEKFSNQNSLQKHKQFMHQEKANSRPESKVQFSFDALQYQNSSQIPQFANSRQQNNNSVMNSNRSSKQSSVIKFQQQYEQEFDKMNGQLSTPFRKLRVTKKQYQNWSDKVLNQYRSIMAERASPNDTLIEVNQSTNSIQKQDVSSFVDYSKGNPEQRQMNAYQEYQQQERYRQVGLKKKGSQLSLDQDEEIKQSYLQNDNNAPKHGNEYRIRQLKGQRSPQNQSPQSINIQALRQRKNFESITSINNFSSIKKLENSAKKTLNFTPKSHRLNQPMIYEFDIYVRAATEIQRYFRGYLIRKRICGSFKQLKVHIVKIQRAIRNYLLRLKIKRQKYLEFLDLKSKRILHDIKNFYKIYQKLDKPTYTKKDSMALKAEKHKNKLEKGYMQIRQQISGKLASDKQVQTQSQLIQNSSISLNTYSPNQQLEQSDLHKDQLIMSLKSEVRALKLLLYRDITTTLNFNSQSIDPKDGIGTLVNNHNGQQQYQINTDENEYRSLQILKERLANLQKTNYDNEPFLH